MGGEKYTLSDELDKSARLATLAKWMETMKEKKKTKEVKSVFNSNEVPCAICDNNTDITHNFLTTH